MARILGWPLEAETDPQVTANKEDFSHTTTKKKKNEFCHQLVSLEEHSKHQMRLKPRGTPRFQLDETLSGG